MVKTKRKNKKMKINKKIIKNELTIFKVAATTKSLYGILEPILVHKSKKDDFLLHLHSQQFKM